MGTILATICAREGSKGLPGKNLRLLAGKPLICHTIEQALNIGIFEDVVVSTDSEKIAAVARSAGAKVPFLRPSELATDLAPKIPDVVRHALLEVEKIFHKTYNVVVDMDPTSPLRLASDIIGTINLLEKQNAPNVITATPARKSPYFNLLEYDPDGEIRLSKQTKVIPTCRQQSPACFDMNASIYVWKRSVLVNEDSIFLPGTQLYVMPTERSIDIDEELDFKFVEYLISIRHAS